MTRSSIAPDQTNVLPRLPVFMELTGRRAVIAGGSAGAAWKAELLARAGAKVEIFAAKPEAEMIELAERRGLALHRHAICAADFAGAAIAIGDVEAEAAAAFAQMARKAGVLVNVVDKPAYCDFTFGTIVQRGPVVIGVSTDGAAPVLAQAIRRRIEAILPPALGRWTAAAKSARDMIAHRLPAPALRRAFWERFVDLAFSSRATGKPADEIEAAIDAIAERQAKPGIVTLVGAGPGDPELLTLKAVRTLQQADVILHDDLVSEEVLDLARREAKRILVGKRAGRPSCRQEDITGKLIELGLQGLRVVRLKSGDPMIFGRGGEEIEALREAGVAVDVVPGITSASAAAARLGVSLTHRDHAHSVRFITGHGKDGKLPELDWDGIADPETTLMVYMGGKTAGALARRLLARGLAPETPVAMLQNVSRDNETVRTATLIGMGAMSMDVRAPVLIGIGAVFEPVAAKATKSAASLAPMPVR